MTAATSDIAAVGARGGGANDQSSLSRSTSRSAATRALAMVASILARLRRCPRRPSAGPPRPHRNRPPSRCRSRGTRRGSCPLAQDGQPRQTALEGFQAHPFEQARPNRQRLAPFGVVVGPVEHRVRAVSERNSCSRTSRFCSIPDARQCATRPPAASPVRRATSRAPGPSRSSTQSTRRWKPRRTCVNLTASTSAGGDVEGRQHRRWWPAAAAAATHRARISRRQGEQDDATRTRTTR